MSDGNFYKLFETNLQQDGAAAVFELETGESVSRQWLHDLSGRYASAFRQIGCVAGDRIAVQLDKSASAFALYLACMRAGLCYLPMNTAYKSTELAYLLQDARPAAFFRDPSAEQIPREIIPPPTKTFTFGPNGEGSFATLSDGMDETFSTIELDAGAPAALLYTSGTTGRPRGRSSAIGRYLIPRRPWVNSGASLGSMSSFIPCLSFTATASSSRSTLPW
jgi:malonyl-CoA/methylmalonyl-CoA synthetase